jgi:tRNA modification GTPase
LLEAQIDFSEEDFEVNSDEMRLITKDCTESVSNLLSTFAHGKVVRNGIRVTIIGKPNVGKSSLLNALLGEDRAIVTPIPGTTRDAIEETVDFEGIPVVLTDTAGLRDPDRADAVERLGMQRTTAAVAGAQMLLTVFDASEPLNTEDHCVLEAAAGSPQVIVLNKVDLRMCFDDSVLRDLTNGHSVVRVSAKDHTGLADLRRCVAAQATASPSPESCGAIIANVRHADALGKALHCLELACESIDERRPPELVAVDVQDAIDYIGAITGLITTDDVLDRVFSEFCIGK